MASVTFVHATCVYPGASQPSVDDLCLSIRDGEFLVLVGPSGCGKSTTLRMLAGLEFVDSGSILIGGEDVTLQDPRERDIAMVFQNYALYPHMTVAENMGFALKLAKVEKKEIERRVGEAARLLDLTELLGRKPKALSGGQRQRVAMGRAIVRSPKVFLMDEPLSNLDARLRVQTRAQIAQLQRRLGTTTVYVTHDQVEAMTMGDRVAVLRDGKLQQVDTPRALFDYPANAFVAGFIGSPAMNILSVPVKVNTALVGDTRIPLPGRLLDRPPFESIKVGFRPERVSAAETVQPEETVLPEKSVGVAAAEESVLRPSVVVPGEGGHRLREFDLFMRVDLVEELGSSAYAHGHLCTAQGKEVDGHRLTSLVAWQNPPQRGDLLRVTVSMGALHFFTDDEAGVALWGKSLANAARVAGVDR